MVSLFLFFKNLKTLLTAVLKLLAISNLIFLLICLTKNFVCLPIINTLIIFLLNSSIFILSFFFGKPPVIQRILLFDFKAYFVDSKEVAFESLIKVLLSNFKKISCLWAKPLKDFKDLKKAFLLTLKILDIK